MSLHTDLNTCTFVLDYITTPVDNVTTLKPVNFFPNQKPWMNSDVRLLLKVRDAALKAGDAEAYGIARSNLKRGIRTLNPDECGKAYKPSLTTDQPHRVSQPALPSSIMSSII